MNQIPTHKISEVFDGEIASVKYVSEENCKPPFIYAHRDDYYMFFLIDKGECKIMIDFEECEFTEHTVRCVLPGQVHLPVSNTNASGWRLAVDSMLVKDEYKVIFERNSFSKRKIRQLCTN